MGDEGENRHGNLDEEREKIRQLQSEQARKSEALQRLQKKKEVLKQELLERNTELENLKRDYDLENQRAKKNKEGATNAREEEAINTFMRSEVRRLLKERVPMMADIQHGDQLALHDGRNEKAHDEIGGVDGKVHDTVAVSYMNFQPDGKLEDYKMTVRIDAKTTIRLLHKDACAYWGCSTKEFVLCKLDGITAVEFEESKLDNCLQDGEILKLSEEAHLLLINKEQKEQWNTENRRKNDKKVPSHVAKEGEQVDPEKIKARMQNIARENLLEEEVDAFVTALKPWPGLHNLLKKPRPKKDKIGNRIKFRDIVIFGILAILTAACMACRSPTSYYQVLKGLYATLENGHPNSTSTGNHDFSDIKSLEEFQMWLSGSFHYQLFDANSTLREFYTPIGFMRVRQQMVLRTECIRKDHIPASQSRECYFVEVTGLSRQTSTLPMIAESTNSTFFSEKGKQSFLGSGRMATPNPRYFFDDDGSLEPVWGMIQNYDGSGYMVDYKIAPENISAAGDTFAMNIPDIFKWIDPLKTRLITVDVALANYHLHTYIAVTFALELSPSGAVVPQVLTKPFYVFNSDRGRIADALDWLRGIIIYGYILTFRVYFETKRFTDMGQKGFTYATSFFGIADAVIIASFTAFLAMRGLIPPVSPLTLTGFYSYQKEAMIQEQSLILDAFLLSTLLFRWASFMRIFAKAYRFWKIAMISVRMFIYYFAIFIPVTFGIVFLAVSIWSPFVYEFSNWWDAFLRIIVSMRYHVPARTFVRYYEAWSVVFVIFFFMAIPLFFINAFLAIAVHTCFEVRLLLGSGESSTEQWDYDKWLDWLLWSPIYRFFTGNEPGSSSREDADDGTGMDGDEDGEDYDDDDEKRA